MFITFSVGLFYLWVCAATLPTLINEIEREEQLATINKLQELLENKNGLLNFKNQNTYYKDDNDDLLLERRNLFVLPRHKHFGKMANEPYYRSNFIQ